MDASKGVLIDETQVGNKISFGYIQIVSIVIGLTIRLEASKFSFDISNPNVGNGLMIFLYPFI